MEIIALSGYARRDKSSITIWLYIKDDVVLSHDYMYQVWGIKAARRILQAA